VVVVVVVMMVVVVVVSGDVSTKTGVGRLKSVKEQETAIGSASLCSVQIGLVMVVVLL